MFLRLASAALLPLVSRCAVVKDAKELPAPLPRPFDCSTRGPIEDLRQPW